MYGHSDGSGHSQRRGGSTAGPALLLTALLGLTLVGVLFHSQTGSTRRAPVVKPQPVVPRGDLAADEQATIELFERCSPSVVYVSPVVRGLQRTLFGYRDVIQTGTGSGFIWDDQGHIVTNFHVIQNADSCLVTLPDNTAYEAGLVGAWADKDVAVLSIDAPREKLTPLPIGTSKDLRVGQKVFAIGNPYGLDFTLTTGVVSALNRQIESVTGRTIQGVIQTDAAINPGNSGGPLLDSAGRLIGMTTSILSSSGASAGIGFAVPVDIINSVVSQLIDHGKVIRPGLGVRTDEAVLRRMGRDGVLIVTVTPGSAAERAGLKPTKVARTGRIVLGDIITKVGDIPTPNTDALLNALEKYEIGQTVEVTVDRNGKTETVSVTLQAID